MRGRGHARRSSGNAHLADQVRAHVRRLGVDTAAQLHEEGDEGGAEAVSHHQQRNLGDRDGSPLHEQDVHDKVEGGDADEAHGQHEEGRKRAAAEADL